MLNDRFHHILLIIKGVQLQNLINLCGKITVFYSFCNCIYGFGAVVLNYKHLDIGMHILITDWNGQCGDSIFEKYHFAIEY